MRPQIGDNIGARLWVAKTKRHARFRDHCARVPEPSVEIDARPDDPRSHQAGRVVVADGSPCPAAVNTPMGRSNAICIKRMAAFTPLFINDLPMRYVAPAIAHPLGKV